MPGPSTNQKQVPAKQGCAGDVIETPRKFGTDGCIRIRVEDGKTTVLTGLNLGASSITIERVIAGKCEGEEYFAPFKDDKDCPWLIKSGDGLQTQPIKLPGDYRLCISPANPNARIAEEVVDAGSAACCAVARTCPPVVVAPPSPPVVCAVTGLPAPLVAPFVWMSNTFSTVGEFVSAVTQSTGGGTYNYATATFTLPAGSTCPVLTVSAVPVEPPAAPVPCPSLPLPNGGYYFHPADIRDPAATVALNDCVVPGQVNGYLFPTAAPGHTVEVLDCDGVVVGFAANCSDCACAHSSDSCGFAESNIKVTGTGSAVATSVPGGYNIHVEPINLCTEVRGFIAGATGSAPLPTDEVMVVRGGTCQKVTLASLLEDRWFANTSMSYNPANGEITITQVDEDGNPANSFTIDIGPFVETPFAAIPSNTVNVTPGGTNGHTPQFNVVVSGAAGNSLQTLGDGLFVGVPAETPLVVTDSDTIDFSQAGTLGHNITGVVKIDPVAGNILTSSANGLSVIPPAGAVETPLAVTLIDGDGNNITSTNVVQSGTNGHTVQITLPADDCVPPTNTPDVLCPGETFVGLDANCAPKNYQLAAECPAPLPSNTVASTVIDVEALSLGGGTPAAPWTVVGNGSLLRGNGLYVGGTSSPANFDIINMPPVLAGDVVFVNIQSAASNGVSANNIDWALTTASLPISDITLVQDTIGFPFFNTGCELATRTTRFAFRVNASGTLNITIPAGDPSTIPYVGVANGVAVIAEVIRGVAPTGAIFSAVDTSHVGRPNQFNTPQTATVTTSLDPAKKTFVSFSARHIGLNSGGPAPGLNIFTGTNAVIETDFNPVGNFICNMWVGTGTVDGNTFAYGYNINAGTSIATCANGGYGDVGNISAVQFNQSSGGGGASAAIPALTLANTVTVPCCTPCDPTAQSFASAVLHSGGVSATLPPETTYRLDYSVNGSYAGSITLDNPDTTAKLVRGGGVLFDDFSQLVGCGTAIQFNSSTELHYVRGVTTGVEISVENAKLIVRGEYA